MFDPYHKMDKLTIIWPQRTKTYLLTCAPNEISNQPVFQRCLIRAFVVRMKKLCNLSKVHQAKILIRLRECAGWSESSLVAHVWGRLFDVTPLMVNHTTKYSCGIQISDQKHNIESNTKYVPLRCPDQTTDTHTFGRSNAHSIIW